MSRSLLVAVGVLSLCGLAFISITSWLNFTEAERTSLIGNALVCWFCGGGPLAGAVLGYLFNTWRRNGFKAGGTKMEDL